jgi:hypothetical protein
MRFATAVALIVLLLGASGQERGMIIRGKVQDAQTGQLLSKSHIYLYSSQSSIPPREVVTESGKFTVIGVPMGIYHVFVSREGYRSIVARELKVSPETIAEISFVLHPLGSRSDSTDVVQSGQPGVDYKMQYLKPEVEKYK